MTAPLSFVERLKSIIGEEKPYGWAARHHISKSSLRYALEGKGIPGGEQLLRMSLAAGVSIDWLLTGEGPVARLHAGDFGQSADYVQIPWVLSTIPRSDVQVQAIEKGPDEDPWIFKISWITQTLRAQPENISFYRIDETDMEPTLPFSQIVLIDHSIKELKANGVYFISNTSSFGFRRLQRTPDNSINIVCDNSEYESFMASEYEFKSIYSIIGKVLWTGRRV